MTTPFLLAPMAELSHRALRELIEYCNSSPRGRDGFYAPDEYFTEMISAGAFVNGGKFEEWYADGGPRPEKLVYQIVGGDADQLVKAVALLDQRECLGIDINMGCSAPAITRSGAGVRWMADIEKAAALIGRARAQTRRRLSVKLRIGIEDDFDYLVRFCRRLEEAGLDFITLHPRTAKEKFKRRAKWEYVSALGRELHIPLAGNGDISSAEEMLARSAECSAVMIGRLAARRPWVFAEARNPAKVSEKKQETETAPPLDLKEIGVLFLDFLARYQPPEFHTSRARRFFNYFCDNLKWGNHVKNLLGRENDLPGMEKAWLTFFREEQPQ